MTMKAVLVAAGALALAATLSATAAQATIIATIDAGQLPDPAGPQYDGQMNIIVNNVSNLAFDTVRFNGFGNTYLLGGLAAHTSELLGLVLYDYDQDVGFQIQVTIGSQQYSSLYITPGDNLTGHFVDYGGTLHDANFAPVTVGNIQANLGGGGGGTGGVPEPASWALMILGFGGVGAVVRRRRAVVAAVAA